MKAISLISGVLFLAFLIAATWIVYSTSIPTLQKIQCSATMEKMKNSFVNLDKIAREVASGGEGSKRTIDINIDEGEIHVRGENNTIYWEYECPEAIVSPRTFQTIGNVIFGSNLDVSAYEGVCSGETSYILENSHLKACFKKIGSPSNFTSYNTSDILLYLYQKDLGEVLPLEYLEITLDDDQTSKEGIGYTQLERQGYNLPYGEVTAYIESNYGINYRILFILESGGDFLIIRGE
jgi:hypothetical protein